MLRALGLFVSLPAAFLLSACGGQASGDTPDPDQATVEAAPVEVVSLARGPIEQVLRYTTHLEAERAVEVRAEAARKVLALHVEEGHRVQRGEPLVELESDAQSNAVVRSDSQVEQARGEYERKLRLFEQKLVSEQDLELARYQLEQSELARSDAKRELSYTVVRAPIAGVVTRRMVRLGDSISVGQPLFEIVDFDSLVALVYVPERELSRVAVGKTARVSPQATPDRRFDARIERLSPIVDPKSGTVKATVAVPYSPGLLPGMFLEVELVTAIEADALLVPKRALVPDGTHVAVWKVAAGDTVERLYIEPRLEDRERITVAGGLAAGDRVVVAGQAGLKPGAKVRLVGASGG